MNLIIIFTSLLFFAFVFSTNGDEIEKSSDKKNLMQGIQATRSNQEDSVKNVTQDCPCEKIDKRVFWSNFSKFEKILLMGSSLFMILFVTVPWFYYLIRDVILLFELKEKFKLPVYLSKDL